VHHKIVQALPEDDSLSRTSTALVVPKLSPSEEQFRDLVADAAESRVPLHILYRSESRGALEWRHVSVQRVVFDAPGRFVAVCHRDNKRKWFRIGRIANGKTEANEAVRAADPDDVERFVAESPADFHANDGVESRFIVRDPEARWVAESLPKGLTFVRTVDGIEVHCARGAVDPIARFVVGLGAAARATTPELAAAVVRIAHGVIAQHED
jgi:predicted DNA-binding transcriptional regulator YafY